MFIFHKWNDYENIFPFALQTASAGHMTVAVSRAPLDLVHELSKGIIFPNSHTVTPSSIVHELLINSRGPRKIFWGVLQLYSFVFRFPGSGLKRLNLLLQRLLTKDLGGEFNRLLMSFDWIVGDHQLRRDIFPYDSIMKAVSQGTTKLALMPHGVHLIDDHAFGMYRRAYNNLQNTRSNLKFHFTRHPEALRNTNGEGAVVFTYPIRYSRRYFEAYLRVNNWLREPLSSLRCVLICEHDYSRFQFESPEYEKLIQKLVSNGYTVTIKAHTRSNRKMTKFRHLYSDDNTTKLMLSAAIVILPWGTVFFDAALLARPIVWVSYLRRKPFGFYPELEGVGYSTSHADDTLSTLDYISQNYDTVVERQETAFERFACKYLEVGSTLIDELSGR